MTMYTVVFKYTDEESKCLAVNQVPNGYSILEVAIDSELALPHNCGMVCSCSSCHIYVNSGGEFLEPISERESEFLERATARQHNSRLGCQSILQPGSGVVEVTIPDQQ